MWYLGSLYPTMYEKNELFRLVNPNPVLKSENSELLVKDDPKKSSLILTI